MIAGHHVTQKNSEKHVLKGVHLRLSCPRSLLISCFSRTDKRSAWRSGSHGIVFACPTANRWPQSTGPATLSSCCRCGRGSTLFSSAPSSSATILKVSVLNTLNMVTLLSCRFVGASAIMLSCGTSDIWHANLEIDKNILSCFCAREDILMLVHVHILFQTAHLQNFFPKEAWLKGDHRSSCQNVPRGHQYYCNLLVFVVEEF